MAMSETVHNKTLIWASTLLSAVYKNIMYESGTLLNVLLCTHNALWDQCTTEAASFTAESSRDVWPCQLVIY